MALKSKFIISLANPHIDYCCEVYTDMKEEHNLKLYRAVNCCIRFIFGVRADEHITPHYVRLGWLKIVPRRTYFVDCLMFNILETGKSKPLYTNFSCRVHESNRTTRAPADSLFQPLCRTELFRRSFRLTAIRLRNGLPSSFQNAKTLAAFKQKLYAHLLRDSSA